MARKCGVCVHPKRVEIEKAMGGPRSQLDIAQEFGLGRLQVARHKQHIGRDKPETVGIEPALVEIVKLKLATQRIMDKAKDEKVRLAAIQRLQGLAELELRVAQESAGAASLTNQPAFQKLAAFLCKSLCPECRDTINRANANALTHGANAYRDSGPRGDTPPE